MHRAVLGGVFVAVAQVVNHFVELPQQPCQTPRHRHAGHRYAGPRLYLRWQKAVKQATDVAETNYKNLTETALKTAKPAAKKR